MDNKGYLFSMVVYPALLQLLCLICALYLYFGHLVDFLQKNSKDPKQETSDEYLSECWLLCFKTLENILKGQGIIQNKTNPLLLSTLSMMADCRAQPAIHITCGMPHHIFTKSVQKYLVVYCNFYSD